MYGFTYGNLTSYLWLNFPELAAKIQMATRWHQCDPVFCNSLLPFNGNLHFCCPNTIIIVQFNIDIEVAGAILEKWVYKDVHLSMNVFFLTSLQCCIMFLNINVIRICKDEHCQCSNIHPVSFHYPNILGKLEKGT